MSMTKYESEVEYILHSNAKVYSVLSDLSNLQKLAAGFTDAEKRKRIVEQVGEEKVAKTEEMLRKLQATPDSVTIEAPMVGNVTLNIVERDEPKLIKFEAAGLPVSVCMWIQILPTDDASCKIKVTLGADVNFLFKGMADQYLPSGAKNVARILATLPYNNI